MLTIEPKNFKKIYALKEHQQTVRVNKLGSTIRQVKPWFQKEAPSSKLNKTPPTGAPKAAATPAAAPPDTKSRFSVSDRKYLKIFKKKKNKR